MNDLFRYEIFRLNYMNIISNWHKPATIVCGRKFRKDLKHVSPILYSHTLNAPSGEKILKIKMEELANAINDTRLSVSKALNGMQENGLLELHRGEIVIPDLERLIS